MLVKVKHPGSPTPAHIAGAPIKMSETPGAIWRRSPLGEHTKEVLHEPGRTLADIQRLRQEGAVG